MAQAIVETPLFDSVQEDKVLWSGMYLVKSSYRTILKEPPHSASYKRVKIGLGFGRLMIRTKGIIYYGEFVKVVY
jgi:hypothetical protein